MDECKIARQIFMNKQTHKTMYGANSFKLEYSLCMQSEVCSPMYTCMYIHIYTGPGNKPKLIWERGSLF